jgi:5-methylcytosine-specific restriction protein A
MSRREFIESYGATCRNWAWSWSFVNHSEKKVIFGVWNEYAESDFLLILSEEWEKKNGRRRAAYGEAVDNIGLIEREGYGLHIFLMSNINKNKAEDGTAKIGGFSKELIRKRLVKIGKNWYAFDEKGADVTSYGEVAHFEGLKDVAKYTEGSLKSFSINTYERSAAARRKCIEHHGYSCAVCSFDFAKVYGVVGERYIHIHHKKPLAEISDEYQVDPIEDLIPVCPNCHAIIHRADPPFTIEQLRSHMQKS